MIIRIFKTITTKRAEIDFFRKTHVQSRTVVIHALADTEIAITFYHFH